MAKILWCCDLWLIPPRIQRVFSCFHILLVVITKKTVTSDDLHWFFICWKWMSSKAHRLVDSSYRCMKSYMSNETKKLVCFYWHLAVTTNTDRATKYVNKYKRCHGIKFTILILNRAVCLPLYYLLREIFMIRYYCQFTLKSNVFLVRPFKLYFDCSIHSLYGELGL